MGPIFGTNMVRVAKILRDLVYPPTCAGCRRSIALHGGLCANCWSSIPFIEKPFCDVLGSPFSHDPGAGILSAEAIANPPVFDRLRCVALHDGIARDLVHQLKYQDRTDLAPIMARWMLRAASTEIEVCDAIVAVPLHRSRLVSRRFNQSAELARHLAQLSGKPFLAHALVRTKRTNRQVGLTATARKTNVRGAFAIAKGHEDQVFGRRLILVDDVYTTGATATAATRALKRAGAGDITVLAFAMALATPI
ncbi:ComF family protein [Agrobacterium sp. ES01]|uniref:ComF family protein n=1 Tax=Agrobacterium sp. ES01 TaxID=3420714 RepID=UPI003D0EBCCC